MPKRNKTQLSHEQQVAHNEGYLAGLRGDSFQSCPYSQPEFGSIWSLAYAEGINDRQMALASKQEADFEKGGNEAVEQHIQSLLNAHGIGDGLSEIEAIKLRVKFMAAVLNGVTRCDVYETLMKVTVLCMYDFEKDYGVEEAKRVGKIYGEALVATLIELMEETSDV